MLIFCDFDGVLHRDGGPEFECLPRLEAVLRDFLDVGVVLTTSWRQLPEYKSLRELCAIFSAELRQRIIGTTPVLSRSRPPYLQHVRHCEILEYLRRHRMTGTPHVILDDDKRNFPAHCPELILCDPLRAFDAQAELQLRERLTQHLGGG